MGIQVHVVDPVTGNVLFVTTLEDKHVSCYGHLCRAHIGKVEDVPEGTGNAGDKNQLQVTYCGHEIDWADFKKHIDELCF